MMSSRFGFSSEQEGLRQEVRRFLAERAPMASVRRWMETPSGFDLALWQQFGGELGLAGVQIPEAYGGQGFGFVELGIVLEELGRSLVGLPYLASIGLAASALLNVASEPQKKALLPAIARGEKIATLAWAEPCASPASAAVWDGSRPAARASVQDDGSHRIDGAKTYVLDGLSADLAVVVAQVASPSCEETLGFFVCSADADGLTRRPLLSVDPTRRLAYFEFDGVRAEWLGAPGEASRAHARTLAHASIALASEMIGVADRAFEMAVAYAKERVQFGRPIGSFQAIQHRLADLLVELEPAKSAAYYAASVAAEDGPELAEVAAIAKALASDTTLRVAADNIQIHGGVGFTWEYDAQLYYKRALWSQAYLGDARLHRERFLCERGI